MTTLTGRIKSIKQPRGGYIPKAGFVQERYTDAAELHEEENIHGSNVGMIVDYMTRFLLTGDKNEAFAIPFMGAVAASMNGYPEMIKAAEKAENQICGLDDTSIINAYTLSRLDIWYRQTSLAMTYGNVLEDGKMPDKDTIENVRTMIQRSVDFFQKEGEFVKAGFDLKGGYSATVRAADGDYLFRKSICDLKVQRQALEKNASLQIVCYWLMGLHSGRKEFSEIDHLTIYNPRLNIAYRYDVAKMTPELRATIEREVLGYEA